MLRSQFGAEIEGREAYVDLVVLNVYGGTGTTNVWIDDLEIMGQVAEVNSPRSRRRSRQRAATAAGNPAPRNRPAAAKGCGCRDPCSWRTDGRSFPRVIEHNGESLEWLQSLGFNAVQLHAPATPIQLREAERLGLWLVAPPPP